MKDLQLFLFDDERAASWQPFTLTRPAGELLLGVLTARARAERVFSTRCAGHLAPGLEGFDEEGAPAVIAASSIDSALPRLYLSSRVILDWSASTDALQEGAITVGGAVAGWYAPAGAAAPDSSFFTDPSSVRTAHGEIPGRVLERPWDLVASNPAQIRADYDAFRGRANASTTEITGQFASINHTPGDLRLGKGVTIEPNVVLDFSHGPIWLDDGVTVRAFTRLAGPAYVGRDSTLLGGPYDAVSIGPVCRIHGEVEESVILGYSNKAHDGFLGHAYLGRWVNLGAMTSNSDLKNNYGNVRLWTPDGEMDTGTMKMGCLLGDHVKTGIGSLINTGTVIGTGSNLYGTAMPPKYVPPFSWGSGDDLVAYDVEKFLATAETAMGRRKVSLSDGGRALLRSAWERARGSQRA